MSDLFGTEGASNAPVRRCPWCSAPAAEDATFCPACNAALVAADPVRTAAIPGVTIVDPEVVRRGDAAHKAAVNALSGGVPRVPGALGLGMAVASAIIKEHDRRSQLPSVDSVAARAEQALAESARRERAANAPTGQESTAHTDDD
jgi:hypothetical protein